MVHFVTFTIGDWSADGHEQSEDFLIASSIPIQDLRELHFAATPLLGFPIGDICAEFEINTPTQEQLAGLRTLGALDDPTLTVTNMQPSDVLALWLAILRAVARHQGTALVLEEEITPPAGVVPFDALEALFAQANGAQGLDLTVAFHGQPAANAVRALFTALKKAAKANGKTLGVTIARTQPATIPTLHFYGFDAHKRHLDVPGYGVFSF